MSTTGTTEGRATKRAGLFDIRSIIAMLLGIYGVVLVLVGLFGGDEQATKADGLNINLWAGIGMIVAAAAFGSWTRLRPTVVKTPDEPDPAGSR